MLSALRGLFQIVVKSKCFWQRFSFHLFPTAALPCTSKEVVQEKKKLLLRSGCGVTTCFQLQEKLPTNGCLHPKAWHAKQRGDSFRCWSWPVSPACARRRAFIFASSVLLVLAASFLKESKKDRSEWHVLLVYNSLHILVSISLKANSSIPVTLLSPVRLRGLLPCGSSHARSPAQKLILRTL